MSERSKAKREFAAWVWAGSWVHYVFYMVVGFALPLGLVIGVIWGVIYGAIRGVVLSYAFLYDATIGAWETQQASIEIRRIHALRRASLERESK